MSYIFDVDDTTVWSPALTVGGIYVALAESIASQLGVSSGLTAEAEDMYDIDADSFTAFIKGVADSQLAAHGVGAVLLDGFLATSIVLMQRGGFGEDVTSSIAGRLAQDPIKLAASMPQ